MLIGEFSLSDPVESEKVFSELRKGIENAGEQYTIDTVNTHVMSSSGILALARVVMPAQKFDKRLTLSTENRMLWQRKTRAALQHFFEGFGNQEREGLPA